MTQISYFMKILLRSKFPQFNLLSVNQFLKELKKRNINLNESNLEYFDKMGFLRPCLLLDRSKLDKLGQKYAISSPENPNYWKELYELGLVKLPRKNDFKPWKKYRTDERLEKMEFFYHPWQILFIKNILRGEITKYSRKYFLSRKFNMTKFLQNERRYYRSWLKIIKESMEERFNPIIGLLMLLEEPYGVELTHRFHFAENDPKTLLKWKKWKNNTYSPNKILKQNTPSLKKIKEIYSNMTYDVNRLDPINPWNPLPDLIKREKKLKLNGDGLLAQDRFDALQLLSFFVRDLTGTPLPSPYDSGGWYTEWKEISYGKPYDITSKKTIDRILSDFLIKRPIICSIIYEGETEDKVIRSIMKSVYVPSPETQGIHLYNTTGSGNMSQKNLDGYVTRANLSENDVYVIIDKDAEKYLKKHLDNNNVKKENIVVWEKDFEEDNFGVEKVVKTINSILRKKGKNPISLDEVKKVMLQKALFEAIKSLVKKYQEFDLTTIITKPELALQIMKPRFEQIKKEYYGNGWKPIYPIEKELQKILGKIPYYFDTI